MANDSVSEMLDELIRDFERSRREAEIEKVLADPEKHRLTRYFDNTRYRRIDVGKTDDGVMLSYCYSSYRNAAGYFLSWRQTFDGEKGERSEWQAHRKRKQARHMAAWKADRARADMGLDPQWEHLLIR